MRTLLTDLKDKSLAPDKMNEKLKLLEEDIQRLKSATMIAKNKMVRHCEDVTD